jgi:hypothetical protein
MYSHPFIHAEFVCSDCGPIGNFEAELRNELIAKLKNEIGVTVREVRQHTQKQKKVDLTVFIRMLTLTKNPKNTAAPHSTILFGHGLCSSHTATH